MMTNITVIPSQLRLKRRNATLVAQFCPCAAQKVPHSMSLFADMMALQLWLYFLLVVPYWNCHYFVDVQLIDNHKNKVDKWQEANLLGFIYRTAPHQEAKQWWGYTPSNVVVISSRMSLYELSMVWATRIKTVVKPSHPQTNAVIAVPWHSGNTLNPTSCEI